MSENETFQFYFNFIFGVQLHNNFVRIPPKLKEKKHTKNTHLHLNIEKKKKENITRSNKRGLGGKKEIIVH